jgi:ribonuclease HII
MEEKKENSSQLLLGIDDAGRGPVIGPMLLAGVLMRKEAAEEVKKLGVMDSKLLTPKKREDLIETIKTKSLASFFKIITPSEIDTGFGEGYNLNEVEAIAAAMIINELVTKLSVQQRETVKIIIDCPSVNTAKWKEQVIKYLKEKKLNISCEHKADFNHPVVSAASIIAKVTRDAEIEKIKKQIGIDFGSGYPSDPKTIDFLKKNHSNFKKERIFRESWATWKEVALRADKSSQSKLF